ncbi:MAG: transglutaminase family protein, partial [Candidatus Coproplasma sp.]
LSDNDLTVNYSVSYEYGTLEITPRPITVVTASNSWVYDGTAHSEESHSVKAGEYGLVEGHRTAVETLTYITEVGSVENVLSVKIYDLSDNDLTVNYSVSYEYGTLEITPRPITVTTASNSWLYDGETHSDGTYSVGGAGLVDGHTTQAFDVAQITDIGQCENTMSIKVYDGKTDVSGNYEISYNFGLLKVTAGQLVVQAGSSSKVYDGTPLTCETYSLTETSVLAAGHVLTAQTQGSQTLIGQSKNEIVDGSVKVKDADGNDVTDCYVISYKYGILEVEPRPVKVTADSAQKDYDGEELVCYGYSVSSDCEYALLENHTIQVVISGSQTLIGKSENLVTEVKIFEKIYEDDLLISETDVSHLYDIQKVSGELKVMIPGELKITTGSAQKVYDGDALTNPDYTVTTNTLGAGYETVYDVQIICTGSITDVGTTHNDCTVKVFADETDVTEFANISITYGELTVDPRPITITTGSGSWQYDGLAHKCEDYSVSDGYIDEVAYAVIEGHTVNVFDFAQITKVGFLPNSVSVEITVVILGKEVEITDNYSVTINYGMLEITASDYDGGDGGSEGGEGKLNISGIIGGSLMSGGYSSDEATFKVYSEKDDTVYFRLLSYGAYTGVSWSVAPVYSEFIDGKYTANYLTGIALDGAGYERNVISIKLFTSDYLLPYYMSVDKAEDTNTYYIPTSDVWFKGNTLTDYSLYYYSYDFVSDGKVAVSGSYQAFEAAYRSFVYENYLAVPDSTNEYLQSVISAEGFSADDSDIVAKVANYIQNAATYNLKYPAALDNSSDMVVSFLRDYKEGICQHYASAATLMFRSLGIPARYTIGYVGETTASEWVGIGSDSAHAWVEVYIDGLGWVNVEVTGSGNGSGGSGGSGSIDGSDEDEETEINLTLKPVDAVKIYDGTPLVASAIEGTDSVSSLALQELIALGYTFNATFGGSITQVGTAQSTIDSIVVKDSSGQEATNVVLTLETGTLTVLDADIPLIKIYPYSLQKYYDGTPIAYEADDYYYTGLPEGWRIEFSLEGISLTDTGVLKSDVLYSLPLKVFDESGNELVAQTDYYVSFECTNLITVDRRNITVTSMSDVKAYDGYPLTNSEYWISAGSLAEGHSITVTVSGTITDIGTTENVIKGCIILDENGNDVTFCYKITKVQGTLEIVSD